MPGPGSSFLDIISTMFSEPVFKGVLYGLLMEPFRSRPEDLRDESVGAFISRRFGSDVADNIVSAVIHGIYAGDIYQLSAKSILGKLYKVEESYDTVLFGTYGESIRDDPLVPLREKQLMASLRSQTMQQDAGPLTELGIFDRIKKSSVYTFKKGIGQLADALEATLNEIPNVTILKNTPIEALELVPGSSDSKVNFGTFFDLAFSLRCLPQIMLSPAKKMDVMENKNHLYSHVISTIAGKTLNLITKPKDCLQPLALTPSVTVMVVNLYYANPDILRAHGFGYLLPRSLPFKQNPERALGVVFDSDATIGQDVTPGTKLTVMLGGHWWDGWDVYPDEEEGAYMARSVLARHLNILDEPKATRVGLQRNCIPQYTVGHADRMHDASKRLLKHFEGRLMVAGNSYSGVGLNDCVRAAYELSWNLQCGREVTGLEDPAGGERMMRRTITEITSAVR
ncbi:oxygen-dependent protoporphyrinogen oxidase [Ptychographa xylographoides]|nr:oxygen-dependent protoporphyrinogen oxidase [Ptychographa xylographoides]